MFTASRLLGEDPVFVRGNGMRLAECLNQSDIRNLRKLRSVTPWMSRFIAKFAFTGDPRALL